MNTYAQKPAQEAEKTIPAEIPVPKEGVEIKFTQGDEAVKDGPAAM